MYRLDHYNRFNWGHLEDTTLRSSSFPLISTLLDLLSYLKKNNYKCLVEETKCLVSHVTFHTSGNVTAMFAYYKEVLVPTKRWCKYIELHW